MIRCGALYLAAAASSVLAYHVGTQRAFATEYDCRILQSNPVMACEGCEDGWTCGDCPQPGGNCSGGSTFEYCTKTWYSTPAAKGSYEIIETKYCYYIYECGCDTTGPCSYDFNEVGHSPDDPVLVSRPGGRCP